MGSVNPPPSEFLPIFNPDVFEALNEALTIGIADARYLKLTGGIVSGLTLFSTGVGAGFAQIYNGTQSTSTTSGALIVAGGVGIGKNIHMGEHILGSDGSSNQPTYSFNSEKKTGMYRDTASGSLLFSVNGSSRLSISTAGVVSIINNLQIPNGTALNPSLYFDNATSTGISRNALSDDIQFSNSGIDNFAIGSSLIFSNQPLTLPSGSSSNCSLHFNFDADTGIYAPAGNQLAISTGGTDRLVFDNSNIIASQNIVIPQGSNTDCAIQFTSNANTGMYSSSTNTINFATNGTNRLSISSSGFVNITNNLTIANGTATSPSLSFQGSSVNTGFYLPSTDTIGISIDGTLRADFNSTRFNFSLPLTLPTTGGTATNLDYYQEYNHSVGWNFGSTNSNVQVGTVRYIRIGKIVTLTMTYDWSAALTMNDAGGGNAVFATATLTTMRPTSAFSSVQFCQVNGTNVAVRVLCRTDGIVEITPLAGGNFANTNTLRVWAFSVSYCIT
jgi:hypothetical protein